MALGRRQRGDLNPLWWWWKWLGVVNTPSSPSTNCFGCSKCRRNQLEVLSHLKPPKARSKTTSRLGHLYVGPGKYVPQAAPEKVSNKHPSQPTCVKRQKVLTYSRCTFLTGFPHFLIFGPCPHRMLWIFPEEHLQEPKKAWLNLLFRPS